MSTANSRSKAIPAFDKELAQALCDLEIPRRMKFSPNGRQVLYHASTDPNKGEHSVSTLWLASSSEPGSSRQLTSGLTDDVAAKWHPDGKQIAFISDRAKRGNMSVIWNLRLDGGDAMPISPKDNVKSISAFEYSPDGGMIAYISADEDSKERKEKREKGESEPNVWGEQWEYNRLRLINVNSEEVSVAVGDNRDVMNLAWAPDGKQIVFSSAKVPEIEEAILSGATISVLIVDSGVVRDLCTVPNGIANLSWGPDDRIYFSAPTPLASHLSSIAVYYVDSTKPSSEPVKAAFGDDDTVLSLRVADGQVLVNRQVRSGHEISDLNGQAILQSNLRLEMWDAVRNSATGKFTLAARLSGVNTPPEVYIVEEGQDKITLSNHGKAFGSRSFGSCNVLTCQSTDGEVELDGLYFVPSIHSREDGAPREPLPTFVWIHGGPNDCACEYFNIDKYYLTPYLLSKGYGVLFPNYRGSTGRGEKFGSYSIGGAGKYAYADVIAITDNAINKGFADRKRLMAGGWSGGGLLTYLCSVRNGLHGLGWRFNAGIAGAGISDMDSLAWTSDVGSTFQAELNGGLVAWNLDRDDTRGRQGSAIWQVANAVEESRRRGGEMVIPPLLILHGEQDGRCPFSQAEGFRRALRTHGLPCEFVGYPGQGHNLMPARLWMDRLERTARWCHTYIGPGMEEQ